MMNRFFFIILVLSFVAPYSLAEKYATIYGIMDVDELVLVELIASKPMQRLKDIYQYGVNIHIKAFKPYTRYEHSLGVFYMLRFFGASLEEQIAGLLHDVSHTVFSHVGDHLFDGQLKNKYRIEAVDSYQDDKHEWFFHQTELVDILSRHGITVKEVLAKNKQFTMLDCELPDICADRLEYILYGGYVEDMLTVQRVREILANVRCEKAIWFFTDVSCAREFAEISLRCTRDTWGGTWNAVSYRWAAQALQRAVDIGILTFEDIHFSTDSEVWNVLRCSDDALIKELVDNVVNCKARHAISCHENFDLHIIQKFRGVDPYVQQTDGSLKRLTEVDPSYRDLFEENKEIMKHGFYISYVPVGV